MKRSLLPLLLAALAGACGAPAHVNAPMGRYAELPVGLEGYGARERLVVEAPACVAILEVLAVDPAFGDPPYHVFLADYPRHANQRRCFEPGTYDFPLDRSLPDGRRRPVCREGERPGLETCHTRIPRGLGLGDRWEMVLLVASDLPVDPETLAWDLNLATALEDELGRALWRVDAREASQRLAPILADVPGSPLWSAVLRTREAR